MKDNFNQHVLALNSQVLEQAIKAKFAGQDPFDGLNSAYFKAFPRLKESWVGLLWTQLHKRSPLNLRRISAIPKARNPKGVALFILGMLEDYALNGDKTFLNRSLELGDWLLSQRCDSIQWKGDCWGYHFDWNARAFFVPKGKPNVITTIYVAQALCRLGEIAKEQRFIDSALDAADFIVKTLYCKHDGLKYFAYIPGETAFVHNASLWAAAWVGYAASRTGNVEYMRLAKEVANESVRMQTESGAWVYGLRHHHQFIDGFHTGYNLEALQMLKLSLKTKDYDSSLENGLLYYKNNLFEKDGTAKYYNDNKYPLDMHCVSQAILTLLKVGDVKVELPLVERIIRKSIDELYLPRLQRFAYQKHRSSTNSISYIRWTHAWVYYSFAFYNRIKSKEV